MKPRYRWTFGFFVLVPFLLTWTAVPTPTPEIQGVAAPLTPPPRSTPQPPPPPVPTAPLLTPQDVLAQHPFLEHSEAGGRACDEANKQWRTKVAKAYPDDSDEEIVGREGLHLFFTTDCTRHSLWQAMALERSWEQVRQPGAITRVVTGCFANDGAADSRYPLMTRTVVDHPRSFIFFTPRMGGRVGSLHTRRCSTPEAGVHWDGTFIMIFRDIDEIATCLGICQMEGSCVSFNYYKSKRECSIHASRTTSQRVSDAQSGECKTPDEDPMTIPAYLASYSPINRPVGALYWLTNARPRERVVALLDPDMIFLRPLLYHIEGHRTSPNEVVEKGRPMGQYYEYLTVQGWEEFYDSICNDTANCGPLGDIRDFATGPPHFMHRHDWANLAPYWIKFTITAKRLWARWTSEMAGLSVGLARLGLRTRLIMDGMWDRPDLVKAFHGRWPSGDRDWQLCSGEHEVCPVAPRSIVRFQGSDGQHQEKPGPDGGGGIVCSFDKMKGGYFDGDPSPMKYKQCFVKRIDETAEERERRGWVYCAAYGETCLLPPGGAYRVRFGPPGGPASEAKATGSTSFMCTTGSTDPGLTKGNVCTFRRIADGKKTSPPGLLDYVPRGDLPSLIHYCYTFEINRFGYPESVWRFRSGQKELEAKSERPLIDYVHWAKYRAFTDWGEGESPGLKTIIDCDSPLFFHLPPLPYMLEHHTTNGDDRVWQVLFAGTIPAINDALLEHKRRYCAPGYATHRNVRTAHDGHYLSMFETVMDPSSQEGFSFIKV